MEISDAKLIYKSQPGDDQLRLISFRTSTCVVKYFTVHELDKFDVIICKLLKYQFNGEGSLADLGYTLGFDMIHNPQENSYRDEAEISLFLYLLNSVSQWGLIEVSLKDKGGASLHLSGNLKVSAVDVIGSQVKLTLLGAKCISFNKKYSFHEGGVERLSFSNLRDVNGEDVKLFPYLSELGCIAKLHPKKHIDYSDDLVSYLESIDSTVLIDELKSQLPKDIVVYDAKDTNLLGVSKSELSVELYSVNGQYELKFFHNEIACETLTDLYKLEVNAKAKELKIEWSLYCKLLHDDSAILDYDTLSPFEDLIDFHSIITDQRINWYDARLLQFIINHCDADSWHLMSKYCPPEVLETLCARYSDKLDWGNLTLRLSDDFLLTNSKKYPWVKELLTVRPTPSSKLIEHFLLDSFSLGSNHESIIDWDWDEIYPFLSRSFLVAHLSDIPFDLTNLTKELDETNFSLVLSNLEALWDWKYISDSFPIDFLISELSLLWPKLDHSIILNRIFFSDSAQKVSYEIFEDLLIGCPDEEKSSFCLNTKEYNWTEKLISFFEKCGLLTWESSNYKPGFELNKSLIWTSDFFSTFYTRITTQKGFSHVSKEITDLSLIDTYPSFAWDWDVLSARMDIVNCPEFVNRHISNLNPYIVANSCDSEYLEEYYSILSLGRLMEDDSRVSQRFTQVASIDFLRSHISLSWNWEEMTRRVYSILKLESIGNPLWIDKWDWDILSGNIELPKILEFSRKYLNHLNWDIIIKRLTSEFALEGNNIEVLATAISNHQRSTELWTSLTNVFDSETILSLFQKFPDKKFRWDIGVIYDREDFDVRKHIDSDSDFIDWDKLSSSQSVNRLFSKLKKQSTKSLWLRELRQLITAPTYHWNFQKLTRLENILSSPNLFDLDVDWDWGFISANAKWINVTRKAGNTYFFKHYISKLSFYELSSREDIGLTEKLILQYNESGWNWDALINNPSISFSFEFILEHNSLSWNWENLSNREDLTNDTISKLEDKEWDWYVITSKDFFIPTKELLNKILSKQCEINWFEISKNKSLTTDIISSFWEKLNISAVIENHDDFLGLLTPGLIMKHAFTFPWDCYNYNISDNNITMEMVKELGEYLDWEKVSNSQLLSFSATFIQKYEAKWYWTILAENPKVREQVPEFSSLFAKQLNRASFIQRLKRKNPTPRIYHFTHLYNAIEVIKSRKILSRDRAIELGLLRFDSAGSVIGRSSKAHAYARFYFRPGTPTQYYNEALGADSKLGHTNKRGEWKSKYPQARILGLPKCPLPVFFEFDLEEVISAMPELCFYSDRNMQSDNPQIFAVERDTDKLGIEYLYSTQRDAFNAAKGYSSFAYDVYAHEMSNFKKYAQQEFLVKSEFDFSNLRSFKIICYSPEAAEILKAILGDDPICDKIEYSPRLFENENRQIDISITSHQIEIDTDFQDPYRFIIRSPKMDEIAFDFSNYGTTVLRETDSEIEVTGKFSLESTLSPVSIYFYDPQARTKEWLIYQTTPSEIIDSYKLGIDKSLKNCISKFEDFVKSLPIQIGSDLFYPSMLNSYHGIAHTYRVLFNSFLLASLSNATSQDIFACGVAAIIHDLGKHDDREGKIHGENSVIRCADLVSQSVTDSKIYQRIMNAVKYHSIPDEDTPTEIQNDFIWKVLKDADALDRARFNGNGCDSSFLRLPIFNTHDGQSVIELTSLLPGWTSHLAWKHPNEEFINNLNRFIK